MKKPSQHLIAEVPRSVIKVELTIGIDLGDVWSHYSTLRRWGLRLAACGGKQCHNRAIVAVARKLAVLLHRIWITQEPYIPFYAVAA
jgi:hypothetical protein